MKTLLILTLIGTILYSDHVHAVRTRLNIDIKSHAINSIRSHYQKESICGSERYQCRSGNCVKEYKNMKHDIKDNLDYIECHVDGSHATCVLKVNLLNDFGASTEKVGLALSRTLLKFNINDDIGLGFTVNYMIDNREDGLEIKFSKSSSNSISGSAIKNLKWKDIIIIRTPAELFNNWLTYEDCQTEDMIQHELLHHPLRLLCGIHYSLTHRGTSSLLQDLFTSTNKGPQMDVFTYGKIDTIDNICSIPMTVLDKSSMFLVSKIIEHSQPPRITNKVEHLEIDDSISDYNWPTHSTDQVAETMINDVDNFTYMGSQDKTVYGMRNNY
jgi:hypothetical protein